MSPWLAMAVAFLFLAGRAAADIVAAGPEFQVNSYTTADQLIRGPSVCRAAGGAFVIVWDDFVSDVFGQRFESGGARLGDEFRVNTYTTGGQMNATVACDGAGNFVVVWSSGYQDGSFGGSFGQRFASDGTPLGTEFQVNSYTTGQQLRPVAGFDAAGNFVVAWDGGGAQEGSAFGIFGQRFTSGGGALGTEFQVNTYTTGEQLGARLAVDPGGDFVVVWQSADQDGAGTGVFAQAFAPTGERSGSEFQVNAYTTGGQDLGAVVPAGTGDFVAVWDSFTTFGTENGAIVRHISPTGAPVGTEFRVNTYAAGAGDEPAVAADADGDLVFTWTSLFLDGSSTGIFGRRYDSSGASIGTEFRVNTYTTGSQMDVSMAADADGDFVVVWNSVGQDGDAFGVFAQRYQDPCGDGTLGPGEQCDVGDRRPDAGLCCSPTCQALAAGTACPDDGVACTADACDGGGACMHAAREDACIACEACDVSLGCIARPRTDCRHPRRASLLLANKARAAKDRLAFGWKKGAATSLADLGDPLASTEFALCVFDRQGDIDRLVLRARAPAGAGWKKAGRKGFRFRARTGLASVAVKSGADGKASAAATGKGAGLALPALGLTPPVEAQLQAGRGGACFAGTFAAPKRNTATLFRAKGD